MGFIKRWQIRKFALISILLMAIYVIFGNTPSHHLSQLIGKEQSVEDETFQENLLPRKLETDPMTKFDENPIILLWYKPFGHAVEYLANPEVCVENLTCNVVYDRTLLKKAESVVFHFNHLEKSSVPKERYHHQLYAWWTGEKTHLKNAKHFDNFFNLTFTYRFDSDVYAPYGSINLILQHISAEGEPTIDELLERKQTNANMAVWAVSNCGIQARMKLAQALEYNGVTVDKFGSCFHREIGKGRYSNEFYDNISKYKFYFAFENGLHCKDYITEKFWFNGLRSGAVPVVWGANKEDLLRVAPTKSFVHADDFATVNELAEYLKYLSRNKTAYAEYLEWRKWAQNPDLIESRLRKENLNNDLRSFCSLCKIIMEDRRKRSLGYPVETRVVKSLYDYWSGQENKDCFREN